MYDQEKNFRELALSLHLFRGRSCVVPVLGTLGLLASKLPEGRFQARELLAVSSALLPSCYWSAGIPDKLLPLLVCFVFDLGSGAVTQVV